MYFFLFCSNKIFFEIGPEMGIFSNLETFEAVREISRTQCSARAAVKRRKRFSTFCVFPMDF